jgi:N-ethylmaleimide reductase
MSTASALFKPTQMGAIEISNRVLMAPLTRNRAFSDGTPKDIAREYYAQRASAGLIITEATQISDIGKGYLDTPGIHSKRQVASWRSITDAVHAVGGRIFVQLWHVGRISHTSLLPEGRSPVAPSAIAANAQTFTAAGFENVSAPIALDQDGIATTIDDFRHAAQAAKDAGFDGVEVHSANGYLLDQFLQDSANKRSDRYGGSFENRARLLNEVLDAVGEIWPVDRIGVRLSPLGQANDISDSDSEALFSYVYDAISARRLAYLHVMEQFPGTEVSAEEKAMMSRLREHYDGFYIGNGGYDAASAVQAVESGHADAIAFGRPFISNPDLPERYRIGAALNEADGSTFYGGDEKGYIDYPFLNKSDPAEQAQRGPVASRG